jgi:hypothetical protein
LALSKEYLFLGCDAGGSGVVVYDISNPSSLKKVGEFTNFTNAATDIPNPRVESIVIDGEFAYVSANGYKFHILDISDAKDIKSVSKFEDGFMVAYDSVIKDNKAYIATDYGLIVADISDKSNPKFVEKIDKIVANSLAISGDIIYAVGRYNSYIYDTKSGYIDADDGNDGWDYASWEYTDIKAYGSNLVTLDGKDLNSKFSLKVNADDLNTSNEASGNYLSSKAYGCDITKEYIYIASNSGLLIYDYYGNYVSSYEGVGRGVDIKVYGDVLFVGDYFKGLFSYDALNLEDKAMGEAYKTQMAGFKIDGDYAYVFGESLDVFSIKDASKLNSVGSYDDYRGISRADFWQERLVYATRANSMMVQYDTSNPLSLSKVGEYDYECGSFVIEGDYMYSYCSEYKDDGSRDYNLKIEQFDSSGMKPALINSYFMYNSSEYNDALKLSVYKDRLFIAEESKIIVVDISDIKNPAIKNEISASYLKDIEISDDKLFVLSQDENGGVVDIYDLDSIDKTNKIDSFSFKASPVKIAVSDKIYILTTTNGVKVYKSADEGSLESIKLSVKEGWNLFANPLESDMMVEDYEIIKNSTHYTYENNSWQKDANIIKVGLGFWLKGSRVDTLEISGKLRGYKGEISSGGKWQLLGFGKDVSVKYENGAIVYVYGAGWDKNPDSIKGGSGFWLKGNISVE